MALYGEKRNNELSDEEEWGQQLWALPRLRARRTTCALLLGIDVLNSALDFGQKLKTCHLCFAQCQNGT